MDTQDLSRLFSRLPDREAFSAIYETLKQPVYTIALRILNNREAAEDVCHDIFVKLYTDPPAPSVQNVSAWVYRMTRNRAIDSLRSQRNRDHDALDDTSIPCRPDWDTRLDLEAAIAALPLRDRELLTLHLNAGLTFQEIAKITNSSLPSVYRAYHRSIKQLRDILNGGDL